MNICCYHSSTDNFQIWPLCLNSCSSASYYKALRLFRKPYPSAYLRPFAFVLPFDTLLTLSFKGTGIFLPYIMYFSSIFITALAASSTASASNITYTEEMDSTVEVSKRSFGIGKIFGGLSGMLGFGSTTSEAECPAVWTQISSQLTEQFLADGQCTDAARAAIRSSFHDCFNGACDGSLILADECSRRENKGLERLCGNLKTVQENTGVGMADLIQFAAAHAIKTCPGGPTVPVKVGRQDSDVANEAGILPSGRAQSGDLIRLFGMFAKTPSLSPIPTNKTPQHPKASLPSTSRLLSEHILPPNNAAPRPISQRNLIRQLAPGTTSTMPRPGAARLPSHFLRTRALHKTRLPCCHSILSLLAKALGTGLLSAR